MRALLVVILVSLATIVNAQKIEFEGYHSKKEGTKTFYKEVSYFEWDVDREKIVFLNTKGLEIRFNIKHVEVVEEDDYVSIYFLSDSGQMISLYYKDVLETCIIVVGSKWYSGKIVKFE